MKCGECKHYERARSVFTGRVLPSQPGFCSYKVQWPKLPKCYQPQCWSLSKVIQFPMKYNIYSGNDLPCDFFEQKVEKKRKNTCKDMFVEHK